MKVFIENLLNRGDEITCITSMTMGDNTPQNYTEILLDPYYRHNLGNKYFPIFFWFKAAHNEA